MFVKIYSKCDFYDSTGLARAGSKCEFQGDI
jgi:hypothetical protein